MRALLEGIQRPQETGTGTSRGLLSFVSTSMCQHHFLLRKTDFYVPENVNVTAYIFPALSSFNFISESPREGLWLTHPEWGVLSLDSPGSRLTHVVRAGRDRAKGEVGWSCSGPTKQSDDIMAVWRGKICITPDHWSSEPLGLRVWITSEGS